MGDSLFTKKQSQNIPNQPQASGGLFSKKQIRPQINTAQISNDLASLSSRIRIIEERYDNLRRKTQVTDQNMLQNNRKLINENKIIQSTLTEITHEISELKEKVKLLIKEIGESARKEDITMLHKYISFWEPINFVTRKEVQRIIKEELEKPETKQKV